MIRRVEAALILAAFLDLAGFGMLVADFQLRAAKIAPAGWPVGPTVGFLLASTFITQTIVSPRWGQLSDRIGRKPIAVGCTVLSGIAMLIYGVADSVWLLLLSRIVSGLGAANVAVAQAYVTDLFDGPERTAALGRMSAAISAGLVLGAPVGGLLSHAGGAGHIGLVAGIASLVGAAVMAILLPRTAPREEAGIKSKLRVIDLRLVREYPSVGRYILIAAVAWFSLATLEGTFARLINQLFGYDAREFGFIFGYESVLGVITGGWLLGIVAKRVRETPLLRSAYVMQGAGLALNPLAALIPIWPMASLAIASTIYAIGSGLANPTINGLCSRVVPENRHGELFGVLQSARSIGFVLGPILGGALFDWHASLPYILAGAVCVLASMMLPREEPLAESGESAEGGPDADVSSATI